MIEVMAGLAVPEWFSVIAECDGTGFRKRFSTEAEAVEYRDELCGMGVPCHLQEESTHYRKRELVELY